MNRWYIALLCLALSGVAGAAVPAKRALLDIADVQGMRANQLVGYGLVVGLSGTGDRSQVKFTGQSSHIGMLKPFDTSGRCRVRRAIGPSTS